MKKVRLYLTNIDLRTRTLRPAKSLEKTILRQDDSGASYGMIHANSFILNPDGTFRVVIKLPEELQQQVDRGEVEVEWVLPKGGAPLFVGDDVVEKIKQLQKKERNKLIHSGRAWKQN
ncbi:MAG: hypothetical protein V1719_02100 [Patescibacteria group bacterium]